MVSAIKPRLISSAPNWFPLVRPLVHYASGRIGESGEKEDESEWALRSLDRVGVC